MRAIEVAIQRSHALRLEVGSYALMHHTGFELMDMFLCCKFAEGDSRILMQKMSRDRLRVFEKKQAATDPASWDEETKMCAALSSKIAADAKACGDKQQAWDDNWQQIYALSEVIMQNTVDSYMAK